MTDTIFCILSEQREHIYDNLRGIESVRAALSRNDLKLEPYALELKTYTESIARLLNGLPLDPRCEKQPDSN
jgi:hypothetical protein